VNIAAANVCAAGALADELARAGVRDVCMSPGSRSAPLALAFDRHPSLRLRMMTDERSAGYFALGAARAAGRPAVLACTSGTAVANFVPAVVEAALARIPLVVVTADRPPELHDVGAAQTIRQSRMFAEHVAWSVDAAVPDASLAVEEIYRALGCRLAAAAADARRPVHANLPFREPLWDDGADALLADLYARHARQARPAAPRVSQARSCALQADLDRIAAELAAEPRGIVVAGPAVGVDLGGAAALARSLGWPLLADPLSGLRYGPGSQSVEDAYDVVLRNETFCARNRPSAVLQVGAPPTSKVLQGALRAWRADSHVLLAERGDWPDPARCATELVWGDSDSNLQALHTRVAASAAGRADERWRASWSQAGARARAALQAEGLPLHEGAVARRVVESLSDGDTLVVGNSMPIRDVDTFAPRCERRLRLHANRGANGIDGVTSTALGIASLSAGRTYLLIGDLSFLHDAGALQVAARHRIDLTVVLVNNDGGGVFSFLARPAVGFEPLFATPHGLDVAAIARAHGADHALVADETELAAELQRATAGIRIVEARIDRESNAAIRERLVSAAAACADSRDEAAA
jgi:2-succinyl-5-enolpyruvyl-6-hydroxy-3-cyclohexene-1-carboxylate synthase